MYKGLYDSFSRWFNNDRGQVYFYSDPHFNDPEMQFIRTNHIGDEEQVKRINSKIGKYDTLIMLGDIGDTEFVKKLHGYKVLIMGNHDKGASNYKRSLYGSGFVHDNHLFDEVYEGALTISEKIVISHVPADFPCMLNIHGHKHDLPYRYDDHHINVCAEAINYTPVSLKEIIRSGCLKNIPTINRNAIDEAVARKQKTVIR